MRTLLRLALAVVGLALAVDGVASLTGKWLGTPPWWTRPDPESAGVFATGRTVSVTYVRALPREGRAWTSAGVVVAGLGLLGLAAWPHGRRPAGPPPNYAGRAPLVVLGLSAAAFGVLALQEELRGIPPSSSRHWPHVVEPEDYASSPPAPDDRLALHGPAAFVVKPPICRGWFPTGVIAAGLGLVAVGAWPRRRHRGAPS